MIQQGTHQARWNVDVKWKRHGKGYKLLSCLNSSLKACWWVAEVQQVRYLDPYPEGGGGYLTMWDMWRPCPEAQPLTLLAEKVPLLYTFYWKEVPLSNTYFRKSCSHFHVVVVGLRQSGLTMGNILVCSAGTPASVAVETNAWVIISVAEIALVLCLWSVGPAT